MRVSIIERIGLKNGTNKLCVTFEQLVKHLAIVNVVAAARSLRRRGCLEYLSLCDWFDKNLLVECVHGSRV